MRSIDKKGVKCFQGFDRSCLEGVYGIPLLAINSYRSIYPKFHFRGETYLRSVWDLVSSPARFWRDNNL